jgi:hypothetical protein
LLDRKVIARVGIPLAFCLAFFGLQSWLFAKGKGDAISQTLIADGAAGISHEMTRQVALAGMNPQDLYRRSWKLIKEQYYDQKV